MKLILCLCLYAIIPKQSYGLETISSYSARIFDYAPVKDNTPRDIITNNVKAIITELDRPGNIDIVVFPEYAITGTDIFTHNNLSAFAVNIPAVDLDMDLCRKVGTHQIISDLACGVQTSPSTKYLVVNLLEVDGDLYNTNVVFGKRGTIIAKYRKINLNEQERTRLKPGTEVGTFTTSFGVTFGLITSDDILYQKPAQDIFKQLNISDVVMTSAFQSEVPFYTSIGLQDGYAKKNGINLLVASISDPANSRGGSGYFIPKTINQVVIPVVPTSQPKTGRLTILDRRDKTAGCNIQLESSGLTASSRGVDAFKTQGMTNIDSYTFKSIVSNENKNLEFEDEICHENMCCKFSIAYLKDIFDISQVYKVAVSDKACGIVACEDEKDNTCGSRNTDLGQVTFNSIKIEAKFDNKESNQYLPVSSNLDLKSINYKYCDSKLETSVEAGETKGLVYLGIIYNASGANAIISSGFMAIVVIIMALFRNF